MNDLRVETDYLNNFRKYNFIELLNERQIYGSSSIVLSNINRALFKKLICSDSYEYKKSLVHYSNTKIDYYNQKVIYSKGKALYELVNINNNYLRFVRKFNDNVIGFLIFEKANLLNTKIVYENENIWNRSFFTLEKNNVIRRYDLDTGELLKVFYLTPTTLSNRSQEIKIKSITWNRIDLDIVCKGCSVVQNRQTNTQQIQKFEDVFYIFNICPFKHKFAFKIEQECFLDNSRDLTSISKTNICEDIIILMFNRHIVRLYSVEWIINTYSNNNNNNTSNNENIYGLDYNGIPFDVILTTPAQTPPLLLEIECFNHVLSIGSVPLHAIYSDIKNRNKLHVYNIEKKTLTGEFELDNIVLDREQIEFHPDQTGSLINLTNKEFSVHEIVRHDCEENEVIYKLREKYKINFLDNEPKNSDGALSDLNEFRKFTSSGREVNLTFYNELTKEDEHLNKNIAFTYDSELNIIGLLISNDEEVNKDPTEDSGGGDGGDDSDNQDDEDFQLKRSCPRKRIKLNKKAFKKPNSNNNICVKLYDNYDGSFLKQFNFTSLKKNNLKNLYELYIDLNYLIVIEKCYQYRLHVFYLNFDRK